MFKQPESDNNTELGKWIVEHLNGIANQMVEKDILFWVLFLERFFKEETDKVSVFTRERIRKNDLEEIVKDFGLKEKEKRNLGLKKVGEGTELRLEEEEKKKVEKNKIKRELDKWKRVEKILDGFDDSIALANWLYRQGVNEFTRRVADRWMLGNGGLRDKGYFLIAFFLGRYTCNEILLYVEVKGSDGVTCLFRKYGRT